MVEKHGKYPANARVDVDYSKGKPKIKFSYPPSKKGIKKETISQHSFGIHTGIIVFILYLCFGWLVTMDIGNQDYPTNCVVQLNKHYINTSVYVDIDGFNITKSNHSKWVSGANFTCDNGFYEVYFSKQNSINYEGGFLGKSKRKGLLITEVLLSMMWLFGLIGYCLNKIVTKILVNSKKYQRWFPEHQANGFISKRFKRYIKFKPKDVENNMVEIPLFSNVELDYKTTGDFDKYLERIKIREHQYNKYKKGKIGKKKIEIFKWYARFYFKKTPKNGHMEVVFQ